MMRIFRRTTRAIVPAALVVGLLVLPAPTFAQTGLSFWAGVGASAQSGKVVFDKDAKQLGVQLGLPVIPIAVRGEALQFGSGFDTDAISYSINGVLRMPLPIVQPYLIVGEGRYAQSKIDKVTGFNAGVGARLGLGRFGIFAEVRRHEAIRRTVSMLGVTF
jgi:hypothetical protein